MNNFIEYFYNLKIDKIVFENRYFTFIHSGYIYKLYILDNEINVNFLTDINSKLLRNTLISEIIYNKNGNVISSYNNTNYILLRIYVNPSKNITLNEINFLSNSLYKENLNIDWGKLWSRKIDYLEELINENGKKYPLIVDSFNYFIGMAENAISYYNNIENIDNYKYFISHKHIRYSDTVEELYNPLNIIYDYKVRDVSEYIKIAFFKGNLNIFNEINLYLMNNPLSLTDVKLLIARLLYPSFYFELYEDILIDDRDEKIIMTIIDKLADYEEYLDSVISYFKYRYNIDEILWLKKRRF